ncbi:MAG: hypothetical protein J6K82_03990, partial [Alphaproteobacteria bacterium]|nr:hypothetical protein [Alphaproteobacteria bacterium]
DNDTNVSLSTFHHQRKHAFALNSINGTIPLSLSLEFCDFQTYYNLSFVPFCVQIITKYVFFHNNIFAQTIE